MEEKNKNKVEKTFVRRKHHVNVAEIGKDLEGSQLIRKSLEESGYEEIDGVPVLKQSHKNRPMDYSAIDNADKNAPSIEY